MGGMTGEAHLPGRSGRHRRSHRVGGVTGRAERRVGRRGRLHHAVHARPVVVEALLVAFPARHAFHRVRQGSRSDAVAAVAVRAAGRPLVTRGEEGRVDAVPGLQGLLRMAVAAGLRDLVGKLAAAGVSLRRGMNVLRIGPVAVGALVPAVDRSLDPCLIDRERERLAVEGARQRLCMTGEAVLRDRDPPLSGGDLPDRVGAVTAGAGSSVRPSDSALMQRIGLQLVVAVAVPADAGEVLPVLLLRPVGCRGMPVERYVPVASGAPEGSVGRPAEHCSVNGDRNDRAVAQDHAHPRCGMAGEAGLGPVVGRLRGGSRRRKEHQQCQEKGTVNKQEAMHAARRTRAPAPRGTGPAVADTFRGRNIRNRAHAAGPPCREDRCARAD